MRNRLLRKWRRVHPHCERDNSDENSDGYYPHSPISQILIHRLLAFGCFADDPQCILTAIHWLAIMGIKCCINLRSRATELIATAFTNGKGGILVLRFAVCAWP
jgi:hypothetical protein